MLASVLALSVGQATAMPVDAATARNAGDGAVVQTASIGMHRRYSGSNSRRARMMRSRRLAPNKFCNNQPSRC